MIVTHGFEHAATVGGSVVAIGKFDGLHRGHRRVVQQLLAEASRRGLRSIVLTFDRNPLEVLAPDRCPESLVSLEQKLDLLAGAGVDETVVLRFTEALAAMSAPAFVERILVGALDARAVLVGKDFRFGAMGAGDLILLRRMGAQQGFDVVLVDDVGSSESHRVSSTEIRTHLARGDVSAAARLLGRWPEVRGEVVHGLQRGRALGFPTANLGPRREVGSDGRERTIPVEGFIPSDGVYAGWLVRMVDGESRREPAAISVGTNPTFTDVPRTVEAHILDVPLHALDLYGDVVRVQFVRQLRPMVAFSDIDALIEQIGRDVDDAKRVLDSADGEQTPWSGSGSVDEVELRESS